MLQYLFRDRQRLMPYGDGYTEWFAIEAWREVLAFLEEQGKRLGIGEPQAIPAPPPRSCPAPTLAGSRRLERLRAAEQRRAERRAAAIEHNATVVEHIRSFINELDAAGAIKGILIYDNMNVGEREAALFLTGWCDELPELVELVFRPPDGRHYMLSVNGGGVTFDRACATITGDRRSFARIELPSKLLLSDDLAEVVPGAEAVRELLLPYVARIGSRLGPQLERLHRWFCAYQRAFNEEFNRRWIGGSDGVWG